MTAATTDIITLTEYQPRFLDRQELAEQEGEHLWQNYSDQIAVEFPSPKTGGKWQLTSQGWVGYIPLSPDRGIVLHPKVPLSNLFRMLEYTYQLRNLKFPEGLHEANSLEDFFERLAKILSDRVMDRVRKGIYRSYDPIEKTLPHLRGKLELSRAIQRPWQVRFPCRYKVHTPDVDDNQILYWTLWKLTRSGIRHDDARLAVQRAYRAFQGSVELTPKYPHDCIRRHYHRLNQDYEPLHALCRFFLENIGPMHELGDRRMLPFLVDMADLFERFVAEWLRAYLPPRWSLQVQEGVTLGEHNELSFQIDLTLYDEDLGRTASVLDTKYKAIGLPSAADVAQVVAYAEVKGVREAVLIYPTELERRFDVPIGTIWVHGRVFRLDGDLDRAGNAFLDSVLQTELPSR